MSIVNFFKSKDKILKYQFLVAFLIGFSSGMPLALYGSTLSMWLARLDISVKTIGLFSLVSLPFSFKFIWSYIFDYIKIPTFSDKLGFRKSWLLLIQLLLIISIILLGQTSPSENIKITAIVAIIVAFFSASQDIIVDALRIEMLKKEEQAIGVSLYIYGYRIAMLTSGAGSLLLAEYFSWSTVFLVMGCTIFISFFAILFMQEPKSSQDRFQSINSILSTKGMSFLCRFKSIIINPLTDLFKIENFLYIVLFIMLYKVPDTMLSSLQSKFYVDMGFTNIQIAYVTKVLGFAMAMLGMFVGGIFYYKYGTFKSLLVIGILQAVSNLVFIPITFESENLLYLSIAVSFENFTWAMNNVAFVAYLSSLCKLPYTATQYAIISSFANIGRSFIAAPSGYIVHSFGWVNFILITAFIGLPGLLLLYKIFPKGMRNERI